MAHGLPQGSPSPSPPLCATVPRAAMVGKPAWRHGTWGTVERLRVAMLCSVGRDRACAVSYPRESDARCVRARVTMGSGRRERAREQPFMEALYC